MRLASLRFGLVVVLLVSMGALVTANTQIKVSFADPNVMDMIEIPFSAWKFHVKNDPSGQPALFYPQGTEEQRGPSTTYGSMRYALLNTQLVDDFDITWQVMDGWPDGEVRSQAFIFGYQDFSNWYLLYLTYTDTARITRVVNGKQQNLCEPNVAGLWPRNSPTYQDLRVTLTTEGGFKVLRTYLNGEPLGALAECKIPASQYKPGKVGIGSLSYSNVQAMFVKNIELNILN